MRIRLFLLLAALIGISGLCAETAKADFLNAFTGNSQFFYTAPGVPGAVSDGVVNFSVFDNGGTGSFGSLLSGAVPLFGGPSFNGAQYLYLYQIVNTNPIPTDGSLFQIAIAASSAQVISGGYLPNTVFNEANAGDGTPFGKTGPTGSGTSNNTRLGGAESVSGTDVAGDNSPSNLGTLVNGTPFLPNAAISPNMGATDPVGTNFVFTLPSIPTGSFSTIFFFTSNIAPTYSPPSSLFDTGPSDSADIAVPSPEPTSFVLGLAAVVCGFGTVCWSKFRLVANAPDLA